jgi:hypothetical protein
MSYKNRVQQGDNVSPIVFLFVMLEVSTMFKNKKDIHSPKFGHFPSTRRKSGRLINYNHRTKGNLLELSHLIFVGDITFLFETTERLTMGAQFIVDHYAQVGLIMHVGSEWGKKKSEATHIPARANDRQKKAGMIINLNNNTYPYFTECIKYLSSITTGLT